MPIDPIKIPQNVHIEDRIVGPLTLRQILIVGAGAGFSYALYGMLTNAYGALALPVTIMVWIPAVIAAAFAFLRINDLSMFKLMLLMLEQVNKPATRTLSPRRGISVNIRIFSTPEKEGLSKSHPETKNSSQLEELSTLLDREIRQPVVQEPEPLSPLEEEIDVRNEVLEEEEEIHVPTLPVDPTRIRATPLAADPETASANATVSLFRDLSPHV